MKRYLNNERGAGMLLIIVGMLIASIFISFMFFDFFNVFISKRISQTSADAAVLAAAKEAREVYDDRMLDELDEELEDLRELFEEELDDAQQEAEEAVEGDADDEEGGETEPVDEDSLLDDVLEELSRTYRELTMPADIRAWLEDPSTEIDANGALQYFFDDDELSVMACSAIEDDMDRIRDAADHYAEVNGADRNIEVSFNEEEFRIFVESERDGTYVTVDDSLFDGIDADASATIQRPRGIDISCD
jgi:hypothetical protein